MIDMENIAPDPVTLFFIAFVFAILDHLIILSCQPLVGSIIDQFITTAAKLGPHSHDMQISTSKEVNIQSGGFSVCPALSDLMDVTFSLSCQLLSIVKQ